MLELVGFDTALADADLVITGEGKSDLQTFKGKVPMGLLCHSKGEQVALVSGAIDSLAIPALSRAGFMHIVQATPDDMAPSEALNPAIAKANIADAIEELMRK